jgi:FkbM family methyltransferase
MSYHSQIGQDKWVHSVLGNKSNGFFIELGACDGLYYSNTLFFEKTLGWNGICIEPNDNYIQDLRNNRTCIISNSLVYSEEGVEVDFSQCKAASGIIDEHIGPFTKSTVENSVKKVTTTLSNILQSSNAPSIIDYLSLDVEGQEYNILSTFPFDKYTFRCITVEHNEPHIGNKQQMLIRSLLEKNGYTYVKGNDDILNWGHGPIDDFYVYSSLV